MSLKEKKDELLENLAIIEDEYERLAYVIDLGKDHPPLEERLKQEAFRVEGCTSNLWLVPEFKEGYCHYHVDSDSAVTKGIAALLADLYSGQPPEEIIANPPDFLAEAGVPQILSPNRRNGVSNLSAKITSFAERCRDELAGV